MRCTGEIGDVQFDNVKLHHSAAQEWPTYASTEQRDCKKS